jgi:hypothetical protein
LFLFTKQTNKKLVKQEVNGTVILPPLVFPGCTFSQIFSLKGLDFKDRRHLVDYYVPLARIKNYFLPFSLSRVAVAGFEPSIVRFLIRGFFQGATPGALPNFFLFIKILRTLFIDVNMP